MKGYTGNILRVDLTKGKIVKDTISEEFCANWIGGYGFGVKVLWDELKPGVDPLSPDNIFVFATGCVPGTILPTSSKYGVFAKSPLTGLFGMAISSGSVAQQFRRTGYDMIIFYGRAPEPVYFFIDDDDIGLHSAKDLWGEKDTWETEEIIRETYSDKKIAVASIGQAGENLSKIACITNDRNRQAGRTGMGAVMGSKNLKALAFRGSKDVEVADPDGFMKKAYDLIKVATGPATLKYRDLGTPVNTLVLNKLGALPTRNFQQGTFEHAEALSGEVMAEKWVVKKVACSNCPIACDHICYVPSGKYQGTYSSVDFESIFALGSCCGVDDMPAVIKAIELCDRLGLDTMSAGVTIAFGMECFERGIINENDTGGLQLKFGNGDAVVQMVEDMAFRKTPAGKVLADGCRQAALTWGKNSIEFAMQVKGLELPGYLLRSLQTAGLGFAVSIRGGCHLRNGAYSPDVKGKFDRLTTGPGRAKEIIKTENLYCIIDSLIICKFTRGCYSGIDEMAEVYQLISGIPMTGEKLIKAGERIHNLAKCFNIREGASRKDDYLPERCYKDKLQDEPVKGAVIDKAGFDKMLDEYYAERGWDKEGIPSAAKLKELGLDFCINVVGAK
ncbi:MAG: aldehyde ferredoxin oxidoreductase family protein [Candidatus Helarchaeota archaeon]